MLIVNKARTVILNLDNVSCLYVGGNYCTIKYTTSDGGGQLETYPNPSTTDEAMKMFVEQLAKNSVNGFEHDCIIVMPFVDAVEERMKRKNSEGKQANFNFKGHKTKGYGGS